MANLSITTSEVVADAKTRLQVGIAGDPFQPGGVYYWDIATSTYKVADADGGGEKHKARGIAVNTGVATDRVILAVAGLLTIGASASVVAGVVYCLSATGGMICPWGDLVSGDVVTILGVGTENDEIDMGGGIFRTGVAIP